MSGKDRRAAAIAAEVEAAASRPMGYHCITLRPGQTRDEALEAYGLERVGRGDIVYFLEYLCPMGGRFDPDDPPRARSDGSETGIERPGE